LRKDETDNDVWDDINERLYEIIDEVLEREAATPAGSQCGRAQ
jgi:hypothetical protein